MTTYSSRTSGAHPTQSGHEGILELRCSPAPPKLTDQSPNCGALVLYTPAADLTFQDEPPSSPFAKDLLNRILLLFITSQQRRRLQEVTSKHEAALEAVIGDQADKYFHVDVLFTHPKYQGQGFASTLLNTVLQIADEAGRPVWLGSSDVPNTAFYESFGFKKVADIVIGDDDPDQKGEPFITLLMMRPLSTNAVKSIE
ncbi:hypothetical protein BV25DRAFT_1913400 [Artomyces pyxidatus]|uniref:Uncharacterized protein n=1 Tax=Artomyces pyxidatus TaxID=48021 RepID=A0ACB8TBN7_9AGAM|nr:hypothetical protein BV25DRAFT_1913400 [Artomyces pyxidatus]